MSHNGVVPPMARVFLHDGGAYVPYPNVWAVTPRRAREMQEEWRAIARAAWARHGIDADTGELLHA